MLDPLSTLTGAATVVQFIDFARTIICKTGKIYQVTNGILPHEAGTVSAAERLAQLASDLEAPIPFTDMAEKALLAMPAAEREGMRNRCERMNDRLRSIRTECHSMSQELSQRLSQLEVPARFHFRRWKSFRKALKSVWEKDAIDAAARRLDSLRQDLEIHVLAVVKRQTPSRETQEITFIALDQRFAHLSKENKDFVRKLSGLQTAEYTNVVKEMDEFKKAIAQHQKTWFEYFQEFKNHQDIYTARQEAVISSFDQFSHVYRRNAASAVVRYLDDPASKIEDNILASLRFAEINHRLEDIPKKHDGTCRWILDDHDGQGIPGDSLSDWLCQGSGLFWIQGKAASGKSTLMKYIWDAEPTSRHLDAWRGRGAIAEGVFFFWGAGSVEQRSQAGLFRSLLHAVLKWETSLIPEVFGEEWGRKSKELTFSPRLAREKWSLGRLKAALQKLVSLASEKLRMCFFIDGLDEYDGDAAEIADFMYNISQQSSNAKFCISSRPWPIFQDIFKGAPTLKVQDLNRDDIDRYVRESLGQNAHWEHLSKKSRSEALGLMDDIVRKADGVFFWVVLVVKSLITGLRNGDEFTHLKIRVGHLPAELEDLFDVLMGQIGSEDRVESSKIFQIFRAAKQQMDILTLERALRCTSFQDALDMPLVAKVSPGQEACQLDIVKSDLTRFWARVNSRTAGMLESPSNAWKERWLRHWETKNPLFVHAANEKATFQRVCYLHRTVKDYLDRDDVWAGIVSLTDATFDPNTALLMAFVVEAKTIGLSLEFRHICDAGLQIFQKAARLSPSASEHNDKLLECLDNTLTNCASIAKTANTPHFQHWSDLSPWDSANYGNFKAVVVATGLSWYLGTSQWSKKRKLHENDEYAYSHQREPGSSSERRPEVGQQLPSRNRQSAARRGRSRGKKKGEKSWERVKSISRLLRVSVYPAGKVNYEFMQRRATRPALIKAHRV